MELFPRYVLIKIMATHTKVITWEIIQDCGWTLDSVGLPNNLGKAMLIALEMKQKHDCEYIEVSRLGIRGEKLKTDEEALTTMFESLEW